MFEPKMFNYRVIFIFVLFYFVQDIKLVDAKGRVTYLEIRDTTIIYANPKFYHNITITSRTYGSNPLYFVTLTFTLLRTIDYSTMVHFDSYAYVPYTNTYVKSLTIDFEWCEFIFDQSVFTNVLKKKYIKEAAICPLPPDSYYFQNMTAPYGRYLKNFPFKQGRLYVNVTLNDEHLATGRMDLQVKEMAADSFHKYADF